MEITVVDDSDWVGWGAAATRKGEVYMSDVASMVVNVISKLNGEKMTRLNVLDHGNMDGVDIGSDWITVANFSNYESQLVKLRPHFAPSSSVHFQHCDIGKNEDLLRLFARMWQVTVYAGTGKQNPIVRFNTGDYVSCTKDGICTTGVSRP